ncbi:monoacylglycerol lipase ABHD12 isoform X1 [Brachionus plicatilis]|uniref:Monoacylglycerol lipase ABHD12 isoform X1 n=1 Tax=Brachionus plicatilis TaxID=10195 RepID=A0A3M7T0W0_BRAPC|nr:monoacylglycerol lipase ABHD12 isoform X1 [Brachionus plicatilis]
MGQKKIRKKTTDRKTYSEPKQVKRTSFMSLIHKNIKTTLKYSFLMYVSLNFLIPIVLYAWPNLMNHMIFQSFIYIPFKNLSNPSDFGLENAYSFTLNHDDIQLGAWHILPEDKSLKSTRNIEEHFRQNFYENHLNNKSITVLYLHGNTNDRSTFHRVGIYKFFRRLGYNVVAVDYRGYGDSSGEPNEIDVVRDALFTYDFIKKHASNTTVYIWGHSLGTGITSSLARILTEQGRAPEGIILESPFYNIVDEVELHPFSWMFYFNKIMFKMIEYSLEKLNLQFRSDIHLTKVSSKILILHAEDDIIIPFFQSEKLYGTVTKHGISPNVTFHRIESHYRCNHNNIYLYPNLPEIIK